MISDILNNFQVNISLVKSIGIIPACYLGYCIYNSNNLVYKNENGLCLDEETFSAVVTQLLSMGIIEKVDDNYNKIVEDKYLALFNLSEPVKCVIDAVPVKKRTKSEVIRDTLKQNVKTSNEELKQAYFDWIDAVFQKQGWMSKKAVTLGEKTVDDYSNHNLDVAIELLNIATIGGYRDMQWAINSYEDNKSRNKTNNKSYNFTKTSVAQKPVELGNEVF